jgi:putative ABC transport system substrate-binding protein
MFQRPHFLSPWRQFLGVFSSIASAPALLAPRMLAQKPPMHVIGYLDSSMPERSPHRLRAFRQALKESGYVEGEDIAIEYRWAEDDRDRMLVMASDLVRRRVRLITASGAPASMAAAKASTRVPAVFVVSEDQIRLGPVARAASNTTGIHFLAAAPAAKRLEFLYALVPSAKRMAVLLNPAEPTIAESDQRDAEQAASSMGLEIRVLNASTIAEIDGAFATLASERHDALFIGSDPFFDSRCVQLAHLATRHVIPAIGGARQYVEAGGLMSYSASLTAAHHQAGVYASRILKGAKPADLPIVLLTKFELTINASTARMLGLAVPPSLLAVADEIIE